MGTRGGYMLIDFRNIPLTAGERVKIAGVTSRLSSRKGNGKPTIITGLNVGGKSYGDIYASISPGDSDYAPPYKAVVIVGSQTLNLDINTGGVKLIIE